MSRTRKPPLPAREASPAPEFDWLVPRKPWFRLREVASICGIGETMVEKLFDAGELLTGHEYNAGGGKRMTKRVPRAFVIGLLVKSARYDAETKLQAFLSCLHEFSPDRLRQIATAANALCQRNSRQASAAATGKATG